ncbi:MAG TPA: cytochrome c [Dongiaceae bacterium]|nr:cytochrome c [Dongiaceae bacterium]
MRRPVAIALAALPAIALLAAFACRGVGAPAPVGSAAPAAPVAAPATATPATTAAPAPAPQPATAPPPVVEAPAAPAPPAGTEIVRDHCLTCHSEDLLRQQRLTAAQWTKTIDKMRTWGSTIAPNRVEWLAAYLAREYGKDSGPYAAERLSAADAATLFAPRPVAALEGGDRTRGLALYADRCQPCHEEEGRGGDGSVTIAGRRIVDRPADLAELVRTGRGDMPSFAETTDAELADLLAYLRSLPR